ncbi:MAG: hypothetical protein IE880_04995 [Epsilonproteobacteria bacterium]|nr:hypothetical protein [Campylobacterota bacterium]
MLSSLDVILLVLAIVGGVLWYMKKTDEALQKNKIPFKPRNIHHSKKRLSF